MKIFHFVLACALMSSSGAYCAQWIEAYKGSSGVTVYFDPASVGGGNDLRQYLELQQYKAARDGVMSILALAEFNCRQHKTRYISATAYAGSMASGDALGSNDNPTSWDDVVDNTNDHLMLQYVCRGGVRFAMGDLKATIVGCNLFVGRNYDDYSNGSANLADVDKVSVIQTDKGSGHPYAIFMEWHYTDKIGATGSYSVFDSRRDAEEAMGTINKEISRCAARPR
ncbi:surface-adhesin E family protein [Paramagnetospirillum magneticum]|uniref:surface-adhesin E family protein n=1 Tax=Paramagnetospirillum magneticum TaxID=84159 RepID=UPI0011D174FF|nr:surface-adhesin E family protein [Paramagnetospirillum magneticum]